MAARNLTPKISRRAVLGMGAVGAAGVGLALTGCVKLTGPTQAKPGMKVGELSKVPVGGSLNFDVDGVKMVVTQPTEGTVVAHSAICTHEGCVVGPRKGVLLCDCHDAEFNPDTGAVINGPAEEPLPAIAVEVRDGVIYTV